ncbi:MAG: LysE family transporter [Chloroflexi bacterium]|nr:LysE family transporter [Chloroflexota bacterium]
MMPGPLLAVAIGQAAQSGFRAGPLLILGHAILELTLVVLLVLGLCRFIGLGLVSSIIGIAGGLVLIWLGLSAVKQGWRGVTVPRFAPGMSLQRGRKLVFSGILASMANPYWFLWWATIGLTYLIWSLQLSLAGVASFFTGHILADLGWYSLVAFAVASGKKAINDTVYRWLIFACGVALAGLGVYFIVSGVKFWLQA